MAMAFVHGGSAVHILSQSVFKFVCGMKPMDIVVSIEEVPEEAIRQTIIEVITANTCKTVVCH